MEENTLGGRRGGGGGVFIARYLDSALNVLGKGSTRKKRQWINFTQAGLFIQDLTPKCVNYVNVKIAKKKNGVIQVQIQCL